LNNSIKRSVAQSAKNAGFREWEVSFSETGSFETRFFNREMSQYKNSRLSSLTFRGVCLGKTGYAATELMTDSSIDEIIRKARANADITDGDAETLYKGADSYPDAPAYDEKLEGVSDAEKVALCAELEAAAYSADERVKSVDYAVMSTQKTSFTIINDRGLDISHMANSAYAFVSARVESGGETKVDGDFWFDNDIDALNVQEIAKNAVSRAVSQFGAKPVKTGEYSIVFENMAACSLIGAFASAFYAENVQTGLSLLKGRVGERVFADFINIRDDARMAASPANVAFDTSGVPASNKSLVTGGVLKGFLYSLKSALKDGFAPTGNGFGNGTRYTHFYLVPGSEAISSVVKNACDGLLITELSGIHAGANAVSGDFSLLARGFVIRSGIICEPTEQITVAGNFYDMMRDARNIGGDLRFTPGAARVGSPSVHVGALKVSGE
jgi:PmbA protein